MPQNETVKDLGLDEYKYHFITKDNPVFKSEEGLSEEVVRKISAHKEEPEWMLDYRLRALEIFNSKPMPDWGADLSGLDLDDIYFYLRPQDRMKRDWDLRAREAPEYYIATAHQQWKLDEFFRSGEANVDNDILADADIICQGRQLAEMRVLEIGCGAGRRT